MFLFTNKEDVDNAKDERVVAKKKLVALLKSLPNIFLVLQVPRSAEDHRLVSALAKFDSSFDVLRSCGCSVGDACKASEWLLLAREVPADKTGKTKGRKKGISRRCVKIIACLCLVVLLGMVGLLVYTVTQSTAGWLPGTCAITIFSNQTCNQGPGRCLVEVMVRGQGAWRVKKDWSLPIYYEAGMGGIPLTKYFSEGLRCCNTGVVNNFGVVGSCCSMWDGQNFCDNWGHTTDVSGKTCPRADWPCVYQLDPENPDGVAELKPYAQPDLAFHFAFIAAAAIGLLASAVALCARSRIQISFSCIKIPSRLQKFLADSEDELEASTDEETPEAADAVPDSDTSEIEKSVVDSKRRASVASVNAQKSAKANDTPRAHRSSIASVSAGTAASSAPIKKYAAASSALPGVVEGDEASEVEEDRKREDEPAHASAYNGYKYIAWTSLSKESKEIEEEDLHDSFKHGDLTILSARAKQAKQELCTTGLVEPLERKHSSQGRPRNPTGSRQKAGKKSRPQSVGAPSSWAWGGQDMTSFEGDHVGDIGSPGPHSPASPAMRRQRSAPPGKRPDRRQSRPTASRSSRGSPSNAWSAESSPSHAWSSHAWSKPSTASWD